MFDYFNGFGITEGQRVADFFLSQAKDMSGRDVSAVVSYQRHPASRTDLEKWKIGHLLVAENPIPNDKIHSFFWDYASDVIVSLKDAQNPSLSYGKLTFKGDKARKKLSMRFEDNDWGDVAPDLKRELLYRRVSSGFRKPIKLVQG